MILLDTHVWLWWFIRPDKISAAQQAAIESAATSGEGIGISAFSCWEVARLVEGGRLTLDAELDAWITMATLESDCGVVSMTREIAVEANRLPGVIHRDPADRVIVATARLLAAPLLTADARILAYPHVDAVA